MKVKIKGDTFHPIVITLETEKELDYMRGIMLGAVGDECKFAAKLLVSLNNLKEQLDNE